MASVALAYICIDTMAYLSMPSGQTAQTRTDFTAWVDAYRKADPSQPYQYSGKDVYAARCSVLHAFGSEAELHRKDTTLAKFGYHNGGKHAFNSAVSPRVVVIGVASFLNDVVIAVDDFMKACQTDASLRARVEVRLPTVIQSMPLPQA